MRYVGGIAGFVNFRLDSEVAPCEMGFRFNA